MKWTSKMPGSSKIMGTAHSEHDLVDRNSDGQDGPKKDGKLCGNLHEDGRHDVEHTAQPRTDPSALAVEAAFNGEVGAQHLQIIFRIFGLLRGLRCGKMRRNGFLF